MTESDIDEFLDDPRCAFLRGIDGLDDPDKHVKLAKALASEVVTNARIAKVLRQWGFPVSVHSVSRHRRFECRCFK